MEEYINHLPSVHDLLDQHHVHMDVAFFLARPMFNHSINVGIYLFLFQITYTLFVTCYVDSF